MRKILLARSERFEASWWEIVFQGSGVAGFSNLRRFQSQSYHIWF
jgi:hypothetical protein